jgi:hypothetical protein
MHLGMSLTRINGVPTLLEQNELIAVVMVNFFTREDGKRLLNRHLFKKRDAKDLQNRKETAIKVQTFPDNGDEQINRDGGPDLSFDGIFGGAVERFNSEMLFDPTEEQFDLPTTPIHVGDGECG